MENEPIFVRFTIDANCDWVEARGNDIAYKTCMASAKQVERVRADNRLCLRPAGKNVRVCKVKSVN